MSDFVISGTTLQSYTGDAKEVIVPDGIQTIDGKAFSYKEIDKVIFPDGLKRMRQFSFFICKVKDISVPSSLEKIETNALPYEPCKIVMRDAETRMATREQLDVSLRVCIPDDENTQAHLLAYQTGKAWANAITSQFANNLNGVFVRAIELLRGEEKLDAKVCSNLVDVALSSIDKLDKTTIVALHDVIAEKNKRSKAVSLLETDPRAAECFTKGPVLESTNPIESFVQENMVWDDAAAKLRKVIKKGVKYVDSDEVCSPDVLVYVLATYARSIPKHAEVRDIKDWRKDCLRFNKAVHRIEPVDRVAAALDQAELLDTLASLVTAGKQEYAAIVPYALYANEKHVQRIIGLINKWVKGEIGLRRRAVVARSGLELNDTKAAIAYFDSIGRLEEYAELRMKRDKELASEAGAGGLSEKRAAAANVLRNTTLADFGFDDDGKRMYELGGKTVTAVLSGDLTIQLFDNAAGKVVKSIPKKGSDPKMYEKVKADIAALRKNIKKVVAGRRDKLFSDFLSGASTPIDNWKSVYLDNPVFRSIAGLVVWVQEGTTFTVKDGTVIDAQGNELILSDTPIVVAHPMEMEAAIVRDWRQYFIDEGLKQPFLQMWEPVVDFDGVAPDRYKDFKIRAYYLRGQEKRGIRQRNLSYCDFDYTFDDCAAQVTYNADERHAITAEDYCIIENFQVEARSRKANHVVAYLDRICFYPRIASGDMTILNDISDVTLAQLLDYIDIATKNEATELAAGLLEYRDEHFAEYAAIDSLVLS